MRMALGLGSYDESELLHNGGLAEDRDPNVVEDRFRVDRRKLEQMLQAGENGTGQSGEDFFQEIMGQTSTRISWPSKLKIGAKSKKDPHIKIEGLPECVRLAREKVMAVLDTKSSRVTLKMDVSHTDHSHIIGKGGGNIKRVMSETGCHIHFPDSNRGSTVDKSNQVSIAGQPLGVECARLQIRELLPLVLTFELPHTGHYPTDATSPPIQYIAQTCNVAISFKLKPRMGGQLAIVRGSQQHLNGIKEAIMKLVEHFTGNIASSVIVSMQLDVAPQHHLFIIGKNGSNIKQIMHSTGASITFPDPNSAQRKGAVYISGSIQSVICARAHLMNCLPLVLMFDLREEDGDVDQEKLNKIMETYDVFVSVKPKPKQPNKSVIVKSSEKNADNMYTARQELLGLDGNDNHASSTFSMNNLSDSPSRTNVNPARQYYGIPNHIPRPPANFHSSPTDERISPPLFWVSSSTPSTLSSSLMSCQSNYGSCPPPPGLGPPSPSHGMSAIYHAPGTSDKIRPHSPPTDSSSALRRRSVERRGSLSLLADPLMSSNSGNDADSQGQCGSGQMSRRKSFEILSGTQNVNLRNSSGSLSSDTGESDSLSLSLTSSLLSKLDAVADSPSLSGPDYDHLQTMASKAMGKKIENPEVRTPTNTWSGMGFSKSMPESAIKELLKANSIGNMLPYNGPVNGSFEDSSSYFSSPRDARSSSFTIHESPRESDSPEESPRAGASTGAIGTRKSAVSFAPSSCKDLENLFERVGLAPKYLAIFRDQEVDLPTFMTLSDEDLKELGVTAFGSRKKMLNAISDLKKSKPEKPEPQPPSASSNSGPFSENSFNTPFHKKFPVGILSHSGKW